MFQNVEDCGMAERIECPYIQQLDEEWVGEAEVPKVIASGTYEEILVFRRTHHIYEG